MDQPPAVAFTAFADVWTRATGTEMGATLCAIGVGRALTFLTCCGALGIIRFTRTRERALGIGRDVTSIHFWGCERFYLC